MHYFQGSRGTDPLRGLVWCTNVIYLVTITGRRQNVGLKIAQSNYFWKYTLGSCNQWWHRVIHIHALSALFFPYIQLNLNLLPQTVWTRIGHRILCRLVWVFSVCKYCQVLNRMDSSWLIDPIMRKRRLYKTHVLARKKNVPLRHFFYTSNRECVFILFYSLYYSQVTYTYNNKRSKYNTMSFSMILVAAKWFKENRFSNS